jgi:hypothetical protein
MIHQCALVDFSCIPAIPPPATSSTSTSTSTESSSTTESSDAISPIAVRNHTDQRHTNDDSHVAHDPIIVVDSPQDLDGLTDIRLSDADMPNAATSTTSTATPVSPPALAQLPPLDQEIDSTEPHTTVPQQTTTATTSPSTTHASPHTVAQEVPPAILLTPGTVCIRPHVLLVAISIDHAAFGIPDAIDPYQRLDMLVQEYQAREPDSAARLQLLRATKVELTKLRCSKQLHNASLELITQLLALLACDITSIFGAAESIVRATCDTQRSSRDSNRSLTITL